MLKTLWWYFGKAVILCDNKGSYSPSLLLTRPFSYGTSCCCHRYRFVRRLIFLRRILSTGKRRWRRLVVGAEANDFSFAQQHRYDTAQMGHRAGFALPSL